MKTILFALVNIISFLIAVTTLEFVPSTTSPFLLITAIILFVVSGFYSVFNQRIWNSAHKDGARSKDFLLVSYRTSASIITSFVVLMSILADFVTVDRNFVLFISYVTVYCALFIPCHVVIFKGETLKQIEL